MRVALFLTPKSLSLAQVLSINGASQELSIDAKLFVFISHSSRREGYTRTHFLKAKSGVYFLEKYQAVPFLPCINSYKTAV